MGFSASDVVPFTQASSHLSDQAKSGAEKIMNKSGDSCAALIAVDRLGYYLRLQRESIHRLLIEDAKRGLADILTYPAAQLQQRKSASSANKVTNKCG